MRRTINRAEAMVGRLLSLTELRDPVLPLSWSSEDVQLGRACMCVCAPVTRLAAAVTLNSQMHGKLHDRHGEMESLSERVPRLLTILLN